MVQLPEGLALHRVRSKSIESVLAGRVRYSPQKSLWFAGMAVAAVLGGAWTFSWSALFVFLVATGSVLLLGHSLGSHRKLIHDSFQCPKWLEYLLVWFGVQVGLAGPIGLLRQHELRDYAQRLPRCHDYLRHGRSFWWDAWWQLHCELQLENPPSIHIEPRIANDRFYRFLERTWMAQQLPPAIALFALGGWGFVFWGTCARVTAGVLGHWLIGWFAHNHGGMHYEVRGAAVQGRNIRLTSLLTMGESWHNNHHAFPGSARLGLFPGEWDPGWWALTLLHKLSLVWDLRLPARMTRRIELHPCDAPGMRGLDPAAPETFEQIVPSLGLLWQLCRQRDLPCEIRGPAANLSAPMLQRLLGPRVPFHLVPDARRLTASLEGQVLQGIPALCVAISRRGPVERLGSLCVAPIAVLLERTRMSFTVA